MKIKKKYWNQIVRKKKTIEFRKINFLDELFKNDTDKYMYNGRIIDLVNDSETYEYLGKIYFNGYQIVEKKTFWDDYKYEVYLDYLYYMRPWIEKNYKFLNEYYKDEKEILILHIEKVEKHNER